MFKDVCLLIVAACCCIGNDAAVAQHAAVVDRGDRIALIGGTMVEQMQKNGYFETALQTLAPEKKLVVRNLGWSGDNVRAEARAVFGSPHDGYARLQRDLAAAKPSLVMIGYGFASALNGMPAAERFPDGLNRLLNDQAATGVRVVLLQPFRMPGVLTPDYPAAHRHVRQAIADAAAQHRLPLIDLAPLVSDADFENGLHLSDHGYRQLGDRLARELLQRSDAAAIDFSAPSLQSLRNRAIEKNQLFFHRYRPQNETYLFLFRKHEQGNNAVDIPRFDPLIDAIDAEIHQTAAP